MVSDKSYRPIKNINSKSNEQQYVRSVLGLAETFEYSKNGNYVFNVDPSNTNVELKRYKSPIQVKIFNNTIYFCALKDEDSPILKKQFTFKMSKKGAENNLGNFELKTPDSFDIVRFMDFAFQNSNWKKL